MPSFCMVLMETTSSFQSLLLLSSWRHAATFANLLLCFQRPQVERLLLSRGEHAYVEAHRHERH